MNFPLALEEKIFKAKEFLVDGRVHNLENLKPQGFPAARLLHAGSRGTLQSLLKCHHLNLVLNLSEAKLLNRVCLQSDSLLKYRSETMWALRIRVP